MARYNLYKNNEFVNSIESDLPFVMAFCQSQGLTYEEVIIPTESDTTPAQLREEAYNTQAVIPFGGDMLTVTQAAQQWQYYAAEGNNVKMDELTALIAEAKASIRAQYPDEEE